MNLNHVVVLLLLGFLAFISFTYYQRRPKRILRGGKARFGFYPGAPGNAFHKLRVFVHPHVKHVITQTLNQEADEDDSGDPDQQNDSVVHMLRQAVRIQRGEKVDRITALLPKEKSRP